MTFQFRFEEARSRAAAAAFEEIDNCSLKMIAVVRVTIHPSTLLTLAAKFRSAFREMRAERLFKNLFVKVANCDIMFT